MWGFEMRLDVDSHAPKKLVLIGYSYLLYTGLDEFIQVQKAIIIRAQNH